MKPVSHIVILILAILTSMAGAHAQSPREQLSQMVEQLRKTPTDNALREKIIKLVAEIKPALVVPAEAERLEGRAQYAFKNAKSDAEMLDAAREYLKAVDTAPWVAGYYYDLCTILEKANRPAEAARACQLYLAAAPQAADAGNVRKLVAGLEYALERERGSVTSRRGCHGFPAKYEGGAKVARIGNRKISLKLMSTLYGGVWRNQITISDITNLSAEDVLMQRIDLDLAPIDRTLRVNDRVEGTPWFRLTIGRDGRITFGGIGSPQAEIVTSSEELNQLRNEQLKECPLAFKDGSFFLEIEQGGPAATRDGRRAAGWLYFASDCRGNLAGDKPGWFPAVMIPHEDTPGITPEQANSRTQGFRMAPSNACQQTRKDNLGWLSQ